MKANTFYLKKSNAIFYFTLLFYSTLIFGQEKGFILKDNKTEEVEFIKENKRIKIFTADGNKYTGRFKIIDDTTVEIDEEKISLESIVKIKRRSVTSAILETVFYLYGGIIAGVGIIGAIFIDPLGLIFVPLSFPFFGTAMLIPGLEESHKVKRWSYSIGVNEVKTD